MKKMSLLVAAAAMVATFASCKKSYHCECTIGTVTTKSASAEYNKKDAAEVEKSCEANGICKWVAE